MQRQITRFSKFVILSVVCALVLLVYPPRTQASSCNIPAPSQLSAQPGPKDGQITLAWGVIPNIDHYTLVYGRESNKYQYGATDIGKQNVNFFTVNALNAGTKYFFRVGSTQNCSSFSQEVSAIAKSGTSISTKTLGVKTNTRVYTVQMGDSLSVIAERFYGDFLATGRIVSSNHIADPNLIIAGQILQIP